MLEQEQEQSSGDLQNLRAHLETTSEFFFVFFKRGWAKIAHERIALRCPAYPWGVATLGGVVGEIRVNGGRWC